ncbi:hypothetical protein EVAR_46286_1 [Eumeta japonica]|uniref:Uncharacterized protein n=1 Tax=Eumeta variegata TaxID=151549 RepID=A0A4C1XY97_EUMVA|nr:hypothetical protein EVAR_46286_1 [Eumeta japonica]
MPRGRNAFDTREIKTNLLTRFVSRVHKETNIHIYVHIHADKHITLHGVEQSSKKDRFAVKTRGQSSRRAALRSSGRTVCTRARAGAGLAARIPTTCVNNTVCFDPLCLEQVLGLNSYLLGIGAARVW